MTTTDTPTRRNYSGSPTPAASGDGRLTVLLPPLPRTASPVPHLTSIHATDGRGPYGDSRYRGNCSGLLIRDLLQYYRPSRVLDPMAGSGTCRDVCRELGITCWSFDLHGGFDAQDEKWFQGIGEYDFIWLHPPYWKMICYGDDPRCLSNAPTLVDFQRRLRRVIRNCHSVLADRGHLAILMGDGKHEGQYMGLPFRTLWLAFQENLWLAAPEIVRFQHGATSSTKQYSTSFIPRLHDICLVLKTRTTGVVTRCMPSSKENRKCSPARTRNTPAR